MNPTQSIILLVFVLVIDIVWLTLSRKGYQRLVQNVQAAPLQIRVLPALLSYACVFIGIAFFAIPLIEMKVKNKSESLWKLCLLYGGGLGLVIYGVFNFTNMAIFKTYEVTMAIRDTVWGIVLFTVSTFLYFTVLK